MANLPKNQVCLVFKRNSSGCMYHVGIYLGDGTVAEMASSAANYQCRSLSANGWTHWGKPKWIDYTADVDPHKCVLDAVKRFQADSRLAVSYPGTILRRV